MTPKAKSEPVTFEDLIEHYKACSQKRTSFARWTFGIVLTIMLALAVPLASRALAGSANDARQDEKISAIEKQQQVIREELAEMRADIKFLVQRERAK